MYLGVPLDEFSRVRSADEVAAARRELGLRRGSVRHRHHHPAARVEREFVSGGCGCPRGRRGGRTHGSCSSGEGPLLPDLEAQAARLGLGDRFVFAGFRRDAARTLSAFDLTVFPSLWEGTPLTAFEALAAGKPIVATDADGLLDILTDNHDALIVPRRDAVALAEKIIWAMDRSGRARAAGRCGASERPAIRHRRLRPEDGAPLHAAPRNLARDPPPGRASRGSVVSHLRGVRVIDARPAGVPAGGAMRHLGAAVSAGLGVVLLAFATTIDFPKTRAGLQG